MGNQGFCYLKVVLLFNHRMTINNKLLKILSFGTLLILVVILIAGSVLEKVIGTSQVYELIYTSPVTLILWGLMAVCASLYLCKKKVHKTFITFTLHLSFVLILIGALTTHLYGIQGKIHLRKGENPSCIYELNDSTQAELPFKVALKEFQLEYYDGTFSPMDYVSKINMTDADGTIHEGKVSMNNICKFQNYRFYQSGYDKDGEGTILAISYDPYGITITYIGYASLLLCMLSFFFQKNNRLTALLKHPILKKMGTIGCLLLLPVAAMAADRPQALPKKAAEAFGNLYVYYNDRICPMQTLAKDFTIKLYGKSTYKGLTAEQVLSGWFFFYDDWKTEPMIRIKDEETRNILGIKGSYASISDFIDFNGYKLEKVLQSNENAGAAIANEKFSLASMASTGSLLKIYPYRLPTDPVSVWYSFADKLPSGIPSGEWGFIRNSMSYVAEKVAMNNHKDVIMLLGKIKKYQIKEGDDLPSETKFKAEKFYNSTNINRILAMASVTLGILTFGIYCRQLLRREKSNKLNLPLLILMGLVGLYLTMHLGLRGFISGHLPMSDGFETMLFMAWCTSILTLIFHRKFTMSIPFGFLICGLAMMVAMLGESNPKITNLIPVLQSPLLSIHVVVIMIAYSLLAFAMLNGVTALILYASHKDCKDEIEYLSVISRIILYPAVFLLTIGIFVGAVWANVSWGRYWGWDPKEVWALITMLVYSLALHPSLSWFKRPMVLHIFCIIAFLTVLITYFGVNFLLGGKHSYA